MQEIDFYLVDAFSDTSFGGNPAAVCPLKEWLPDETLLKMAQQHNQSETAFFVCSKGGIELRWFTTLTEVNLCGHATLAAAHVLFTELDMDNRYVELIQNATGIRIYHFSHMTFGDYDPDLVSREMDHNLKTLVKALSLAAQAS